MNAMKTPFFILCVFIAFLTVAYAGDMYNCVDRKGNHIITDSPQDDMTNCVKSGSDEAVSSSGKSMTSESSTGRTDQKGADSRCDSVSDHMNTARTYLNQAAQKKSSELEEAKEDVRQAFDSLMEAQRMSSYCQCSSLGEEIYSAAQYASSAVNETSVGRFSNLLTRAIQAFNRSQEAFQRCR